jgi:hypothetical protein
VGLRTPTRHHRPPVTRRLLVLGRHGAGPRHCDADLLQL